MDFWEVLQVPAGFYFILDSWSGWAIEAERNVTQKNAHRCRIIQAHKWAPFGKKIPMSLDMKKSNEWGNWTERSSDFLHGRGVKACFSAHTGHSRVLLCIYFVFLICQWILCSRVYAWHNCVWTPKSRHELIAIFPSREFKKTNVSVVFLDRFIDSGMLPCWNRFFFFCLSCGCSCLSCC